ncbi:hypothetical protein [Streptomyces sp. NPDC056682]|uniref:hypothetical protein n=1 Tax=Streptomyces sp. NPDC056682 TaxID=3345909 RepID=UPI0036865AD4
MATNKIAANTCRSPYRRRPPPCGRTGAAGTTRWNNSHNPSGTRRSIIAITAPNLAITPVETISVRAGTRWCHWILTALAEDVTAFAAAAGAEVEFVRVAVTPEQVETHHLPTAPPSATDRRSFSGSTTTQAEALTPNVLAAIVRDAIEARRDMDVLRQTIQREPAERQAIIDRLANVR